MVTKKFWKNRRVLITGHTGFKGTWLSLWLNLLGARVAGYALDPPTQPSLFNLSGIKSNIESIIGDIRNDAKVRQVISDVKPEIIFHLAAQPLVRHSYEYPLETYSTNVMGTGNILEAIRTTGSVKAFVNVTTDKVYQNREWHWGYRENDPLGGYDPYSSSKACSELVTTAYRNSYFHPDNYKEHGVGIATARAGNVIGGGDWAQDRLIPDCIRAFLRNESIYIRNPDAIRPWQYVLEPLKGYLMLAGKLYSNGNVFSRAWNFGPDAEGEKSVGWIASYLLKELGSENSIVIDKSPSPHEAKYLKLDCSLSRAELSWEPKWGIGKAMKATAEWTIAYKKGGDIAKTCEKQIFEFSKPSDGD